MDSPKVKLTTSENQEFEVEWEVFRMFGMFAPQNDPKDCPPGPIPLSQISSSNLEKIIQYCEHHKHDPPQEEDTRKRAPRSEWDEKFITSFDRDTLFEIITASNYLSIKPLLDLGCGQVAEMIKGKSPEGIRKLFNITGGSMPDQEAQIHHENTES